jgi:hypothetical protein
MTSRRFAKFSAVLVGVCCLSACEQPSIDLSGTYMPFDWPWSGLAKIDITTSFPAPLFTGTFTVYLLEYTEVPIVGPVSSQNEIFFLPYHQDPTIIGLCVCQGLDDGSSIFPGSGEIADDGLADRLACSEFLGEPHDPPAELFRADWPEPPLSAE